MTPEGYSSITVPDEVFEQGTTVMIEYSCESIADAAAAASAIGVARGPGTCRASLPFGRSLHAQLAPGRSSLTAGLGPCRREAQPARGLSHHREKTRWYRTLAMN